ncbi:MAG: crossover junction endodeoxyribonuclease RuvC [Myxococcota bacterium]
MIVIGIDPGTRYTGYGIIEKRGSALTRLCSGRVVAGTSKDPLPERMGLIHEGLTEIFSTYAPEACALEGIFMAKNAMSALKLGHARGVVMLTARLHHAPVYEYPPASVKQAVTGSGRATKDTVQLMVRRLLGYTSAMSEDESDALAAAICHCNTQSFYQRLRT